MAYTAEQQHFIDEANRRAAENGTTPEEELWRYAQSIGYAPEQVDAFFGWPSGSTRNWAMVNGHIPAPMYVPSPAPTPTPTPTPTQSVTPLAPAERENIISQAKLIATTTGITPEEALYRYAKTQGVSHSQLDQYMGWPDGTTAQWAQANPASKAVQLTSASRSRVSPLSDTQRQSIVADAQKTAQLLGISPEEALYRYAQTQGLSPSQVDQYMGWPTGTTARWAKENVPAPSAAPVQPLSGAQRDSIIEQAKKIAKLLGISTEEALYRYSQAQGLTPAQVDQYMGWGEGTTAQWAATNFDTQQPSAYKGAIDTTLQAPVQPIDQSKYRHALPTSLQKQEYNRLGDIVLPPGQVSSTPQGMQHITGVYQSAPPLYDYTNAQGALAQPPATGPSAVVPGAEGTSSLGATNKYLHDLLGIGKPLA